VSTDACQHLTEIEKDTNRLEHIVQSQTDQINQIVTLMSQAGCNANHLLDSNRMCRCYYLEIPSSHCNCSETTEPTKENIIDKVPTTKGAPLNKLFKRLQDLAATQQNTCTLPAPPTITLTNHSPGLSPTESFSTLTCEIVNSTQPQAHVESQQSDTSTSNPMVAIEPPSRELCPVCQVEFIIQSSADHIFMIQHYQSCLFPSDTNSLSKELVCPQCNRKYPSTDEQIYLEHVTDCYNRHDML
jgi:uncharacterized protein YbaR (Trm112 family)